MGDRKAPAGIVMGLHRWFAVEIPMDRRQSDGKSVVIRQAVPQRAGSSAQPSTLNCSEHLRYDRDSTQSQAGTMCARAGAVERNPAG